MPVNIEVHEQYGQLWTTSLEVSRKFEKTHKHVLKAIDLAVARCSAEFSRTNFRPSTYQDERGKEQPAYLLSRGGFSMVAMGFTGEKAFRWKERFIAAFDLMERRIIELSRAAERRASREWQQARHDGKTVRRAASEAIDAFVTYAKAQGSTHAHRYFVTITRMTCRALFTFEPGQEKRMGPTVRDHLDASQLAALAVVEDAVVKALHAGMGEGWPYKTVYHEARKRAHAVATVLGKSPVRASALPASGPASGKRPQPRAAVQLPLWEPRTGRA